MEEAAVVLGTVAAIALWLWTCESQRADAAEVRARRSQERAEEAQAKAATWRSVAWINGRRVAVLERIVAARRQTVAALVRVVRGE